MIASETMTELLKVLFTCGGIPVRENTIYGQFNKEAAGVQTLSVIREHLQFAYSKGWVDYLVTEDDKAKKWWITETGKVNLSNR